MTRGRCWDCKQYGQVGQVPLRVRRGDGGWEPVLVDVKLCQTHGYNNPFPERNCADFRAKPAKHREPLPREERKRWLAGRGGPVTWNS